MTTTLPPGSSSGADLAPLEKIERISHMLRELYELDWVGMPGDRAGEALVALEAVSRGFTALQGELTNAAQASGLWALDGHRSFAAWLSDKTGVTRAGAARVSRLAATLRDHLPHTRQALAEGLITRDHAEIIARHCTKTEKHRLLLQDPDCGEEFMISAAKELDAGQFVKVTQQWAVMADPEAADRGWRESSAKEEVLLSPTMDGYMLSGWLSTLNGAILEKALNAHMGRKSADDLRSPKERRAEALVNLARYSLDTGEKMKSARIRPHITVTSTYETLERLAKATSPVFDSPPLFPPWIVPDGVSKQEVEASLGRLLDGSDEWLTTWRPGSDHMISAGINYTELQGVKPATLADGTPLPPAAFAKLACESMLARVVFGPESTVLDSGREERIFPAHQVRAIIARDQHCQYPGCDSGPDFGEIHHSAEWFKHHGSTHVDLGIVLCWHHHALVHERSITIFRIFGQWVFMDRTGRAITPPDHTNVFPPEPEPPPF